MNSNIVYYAQCRQKLNERIHHIFAECNKIFKHHINTSKDLLKLLDASDKQIEYKSEEPVELVNFKFNSHSITHMSGHVAFYFLCRYQLIKDIMEIIQEIKLLFVDDKQPSISDFECLVDLFLKKQEPQQEKTATTAAAESPRKVVIT